MKQASPSPLPVLDVIIPAIEKDLPTLPYVVAALRKHVLHPLRAIHIVSPDSPRIRAFCQSSGCRFVHENTVLPIRKKDISYRSARFERSGWLYQQLLKLGGDGISRSRHYLVIDADTVLLRPHAFTEGKKAIFYSRSWTQPEYRNAYRRLLGKKPEAPGSFVAHYMVFDKTKLAALKRAIAAQTGLPWVQAILQRIDKTKMFGFSEFETYGHYLHTRSPNLLIRRSTLNKALSGYPSRVTAKEWKELAARYRSVSFHKRGAYLIKGKRATR